MITVIAEVVDKHGNVKRLNNSVVRFDIEGEGRLLGGEVTGVNPQKIEWGSAAALIQATHKAGKIKVTAAMDIPGQARPLEGVLEFESTQSSKREIYAEKERKAAANHVRSEKSKAGHSELEKEITKLRKEINQLKVKEVERQQTRFGVGIND